MKKILVMMYQEGASGLDACRMGSNFALRRMVADANVAIEAFANLGAEVYVCDVYSKGRDIAEEELSPLAQKIALKDLESLCENGLCGVAMIGTHAKNGAADAFYSYTVNETAWHEYRLNGVVLGDIGIGAAYFGAFGVPVVALSGDRAACEEARALLGDIPTAQVKWATKRNVAKSLPLDKAAEEIATACQKGYAEIANCKPLTFETPYTVSITYNRVDYCDDSMVYSFGLAKRIAPLVSEKTVEKIRKYGDLRI